MEINTANRKAWVTFKFKALSHVKQPFQIRISTAYVYRMIFESSIIARLFVSCGKDTA